MAYKIKGSTSFLDTIRADMAETLNLQANKSMHERTLMYPEGGNDEQLAQIQRAYLTISMRLNELLDKYNIS